MWRRDGDNAHTLRITRRGRQATRVDEAHDPMTGVIIDEITRVSVDGVAEALRRIEAYAGRN